MHWNPKINDKGKSIINIVLCYLHLIWDNLLLHLYLLHFVVQND